MAPHSSTLAWKIPWTEGPGGLQSMGSLGVGHDWATSLSLSCTGEGNGNPLQCSCLENPRDGEPGGLPSMGSHRVGHNWNDSAVVAAKSRASMVKPRLQFRRPQFISWIGKIPWRRDRLPNPVVLGFPGGSVGKESACNVGDLGSSPGLGRSPGGGHGNPLASMGFPGGSDGKESACNAGDLGSIPGLGRSLEKGTATQTSILAWRIPWTEEPGRLQSIGLQKAGHDWATFTSAKSTLALCKNEEGRLEEMADSQCRAGKVNRHWAPSCARKCSKSDVNMLRRYWGQLAGVSQGESEHQNK